MLLQIYREFTEEGGWVDQQRSDHVRPFPSYLPPTLTVTAIIS